MQNKNSDPNLGKATDWSFANQLLGGRDKVEKVIRSHPSCPCVVSESQHRIKKKGEQEREKERVEFKIQLVSLKASKLYFFGHGWVPMSFLIREIQ